MTETKSLFAVCRDADGLVAKRVPLDARIQDDIAEIFDSQEASFLDGVTEEIAFDGTWKPDADQLLFIDAPPESSVLIDAANASSVSTRPIDTARFSEEGIRALFWSKHEDGRQTILVQQFNRRQMLDHKWTLLLSGNAFRRITGAAFVMPSSLTCILESGRIKFKSWSNLRTIFNVTEVYRAATDQEVEGFGQHQVEGFGQHQAVRVDNIEQLVEESDQPMRKMISQVLSDGTLDEYPASEIHRAAAQTRLPIDLDGDKIVWPQTRREQKDLLQFLVDNRYFGALSKRVYVTNSRRPVP